MKKRRFETCVIWDKAIDIPESDLAGYCADRDMEKLTFRDGHRPTVYVLRDIPNSLAVQHLFNEPSQDLKRLRAFQMSIVAIRDVKLRDGRELPEWRPRAVAELEGGLIDQTPFLVSQDEIDELFHLANVLDVGEVAHARAFLPPEIDAGYLLPPTSRQCLTASVQLFAALVQNTPAGGTSAETPAPATPPPEEAADAGGGAHATA